MTYLNGYYTLQHLWVEMGKRASLYSVHVNNHTTCTNSLSVVSHGNRGLVAPQSFVLKQCGSVHEVLLRGIEVLGA